MNSADSIVSALLDSTEDELSPEEAQRYFDNLIKIQLPAQVKCDSVESFYYDKLIEYGLTHLDVHTGYWGKNHAVQMYHEFGGGIIFAERYPSFYYSDLSRSGIYVAAWVPPLNMANPDPPGLGY